jgi:hypothetical protein
MRNKTMRIIHLMNRVGVVLGVIVLSAAVAPEAAAFELKVKGVFCGGHEWLSVQAAKSAGLPEKFNRSLELGARYVDMGGMVMSKDWLFGHMKEEVHRGPGVSHNHFCLRGGASDLADLIRDAAARIRYLLTRAVETDDATKVALLDGGILAATKETAYARYALLGAALHTVQDSFAHGYRTPTAGKTALNETAFEGLYRKIKQAVLVPEPKAGTLEHNHVYSKKDGSPHKSDQIFNATVCSLESRGIRDLQPHAYAALLASRDFLRVFKAAADGNKSWGQRLDAFMEKWFTDPSGSFPGYGKEYGKCESRANCKRRLIPGEPGYQMAKTVGQQIVDGANKLAQEAKGQTDAALGSARRTADTGVKKVTSTAQQAVKGAKDTAKRAKEGGKKLLKKIGF